jgi:hypothetical protein
MHWFILLALLTGPSDAAVRRSTGITKAQCAELRSAVKTHGVAAVYVGAVLRGYKPAQISYARKVCNV